MELNWLQSLAFGLVSGLTDILPVSSQAHQTLLLTFFGAEESIPAIRLVVHCATLLALLICQRGYISHLRRQLRLANLPRRRRNRPVDMTALMDVKIYKTALIPMIALLLLWGVIRRFDSLLLLAGISLINAVVLYLPGLLPGADKDSRLVTPAESILMGLGTGAAVLPGISSVGMSFSIGVLHGIDRVYMVHLSLVMQMIFTAGMIVYDVLDIASYGLQISGYMGLIGLILVGCCAAVGTVLGVNMLHRAGHGQGLTRFSFYSFGLALMAFILYLIV